MLFDWRRRRREKKELRNQIIEEAEEYKKAFYEKRKLNIETNKSTNREERSYIWPIKKSSTKRLINSTGTEIIPNEVPNIEKRRKKKDQDNNYKPSITVVQGPKSGKSTDLSRMIGILVKLEHNPPPHMIPPPPAPAKDAKDGKNNKNAKDTAANAAKEATQPAPGKGSISNGAPQTAEEPAAPVNGLPAS